MLRGHGLMTDEAMTQEEEGKEGLGPPLRK